MTQGRVVTLGVLLAALGVLGGAAADLPGFSERGAVTFAALVVLPAVMATVWLALPLAWSNRTLLLAGGALAGVLWVVCYFAGLGVAANIARLACFVFVGFWFLSLFEALWWLALVAVAVPWVDTWSVSSGPTRYVTDEQPGFFDSISVALHVPGETGTANIGPPDFVFFALFLAAAQRFRLRVALTWIAMTALLSATLVLVWLTDASGLPALPAVCLGFVLPNVDFIWRDVQYALAERAARQKAEKPSG